MPDDERRTEYVAEAHHILGHVLQEGSHGPFDAKYGHCQQCVDMIAGGLNSAYRAGAKQLDHAIAALSIANKALLILTDERDAIRGEVEKLKDRNGSD